MALGSSVSVPITNEALIKNDSDSMRFKNRNSCTRATALIPGGVNSPARSCRAVGSDPIFIERADGAMFDVDGNKYIDYAAHGAR